MAKPFEQLALVKKAMEEFEQKFLVHAAAAGPYSPTHSDEATWHFPWHDICEDNTDMHVELGSDKGKLIVNFFDRRKKKQILCSFYKLHETDPDAEISWWLGEHKKYDWLEYKDMLFQTWDYATGDYLGSNESHDKAYWLLRDPSDVSYIDHYAKLVEQETASLSTNNDYKQLAYDIIKTVRNDQPQWHTGRVRWTYIKELDKIIKDLDDIIKEQERFAEQPDKNEEEREDDETIAHKKEYYKYLVEIANEVYKLVSKKLVYEHFQKKIKAFCKKNEDFENEYHELEKNAEKNPLLYDYEKWETTTDPHTGEKKLTPPWIYQMKNPPEGYDEYVWYNEFWGKPTKTPNLMEFIINPLCRYNPFVIYWNQDNATKVNDEEKLLCSYALLVSIHDEFTEQPIYTNKVYNESWSCRDSWIGSLQIQYSSENHFGMVESFFPFHDFKAWIERALVDVKADLANLDISEKQNDEPIIAEEESIYTIEDEEELEEIKKSDWGFSKESFADDPIEFLYDISSHFKSFADSLNFIAYEHQNLKKLNNLKDKNKINLINKAIRDIKSWFKDIYTAKCLISGTEKIKSYIFGNEEIKEAHSIIKEGLSFLYLFADEGELFHMDFLYETNAKPFPNKQRIISLAENFVSYLKRLDLSSKLEMTSSKLRIYCDTHVVPETKTKTNQQPKPVETGQKNGLSKEPPQLTYTESTIIEALGRNTLIGEKIAISAKYPYNSNFKNTLSSLRKRGILENKSPGYFLKPEYYGLLKKSD